MSQTIDLLIKNGSCFIEGKLEKVDLAVNNSQIQEIGKLKNLEGKSEVDAKDLLVLPGVIDTQVHFREPGSTDAEDLNSGSKAAILGGVTSVFEMPNTDPPTSSKKEFLNKLSLAKNRMFCNYAFYFGATPNNHNDLRDLKSLEGCCGIKLFAGSSTGNLLVKNEEDIEKVFLNSSKIVSVHSEDEAILNLRKKLIETGNVKTHPVWRNEESAISSTRKIVKIAERLNKKAHILHVTTKEEVDFLSQHKGKVTFEITPQHLTFVSPDCYDDLGTYVQMNPPIRNKDHQDRLWYAVKNNLVDIIGSDHAPHLKVNKDKKYPQSPSGMPGVQTLLPIMLDHINRNRLSIKQLVSFVCENPAKIFNIKNKGFIKIGNGADLTIIDMNKVVKIDNNKIESKCKWSPFHGVEVKGFPVITIVNGEIKMKNGKITGKPGGKPLKF
jgi:dihydroorotase